MGSIVAGSVVTLRGEMNKQGAVLLVSVLLYGVATIFFGLTTSVVLAFVFMALTGAADTVSTVIRGTLRQLLSHTGGLIDEPAEFGPPGEEGLAAYPRTWTGWPASNAGR